MIQIYLNILVTFEISGLKTTSSCNKSFLGFSSRATLPIRLKCSSAMRKSLVWHGTATVAPTCNTSIVAQSYNLLRAMHCIAMCSATRKVKSIVGQHGTVAPCNTSTVAQSSPVTTVLVKLKEQLFQLWPN